MIPHLRFNVRPNVAGEIDLPLFLRHSPGFHNGEDFGKLAAEYSDDPGSARQGVSLLEQFDRSFSSVGALLDVAKDSPWYRQMVSVVTAVAKYAQVSSQSWVACSAVSVLSTVVPASVVTPVLVAPPVELPPTPVVLPPMAVAPPVLELAPVPSVSLSPREKYAPTPIMISRYTASTA